MITYHPEIEKFLQTQTPGRKLTVFGASSEANIRNTIPAFA